MFKRADAAGEGGVILAGAGGGEGQPAAPRDGEKSAQVVPVEFPHGVWGLSHKGIGTILMDCLRPL